ncbi:hypothetical protein D3C76_1870050 [compost metagenome]
MAIEQCPCFGHLQAPGGAVEQLRAELALKVFHLARQHGMGHPGLNGGGTETAEIDHPAKGLHGA